MNRFKLTSETVQPIKSVYSEDKQLVIKNERTINTSQGLSLHVNNMQQEPTDVKYQDGSLLTLTDKKYLRKSLKLNIAGGSSIYPYSFISYMVFNANKQLFYKRPDRLASPTSYPGGDPLAVFLNIEELESDQDTRSYTISSGDVYEPQVVSGNVPNTRLFRFELIDEQYCRVYHADEYVETCLTYSDMDSTTAEVEFRRHDDSSNDSSHPQVFEYVYQPEEGYISLAKIINDGSRVVITLQERNTSDLSHEGGKLAGHGLTTVDDITWPLKSMIHVRPKSFVVTSTKLESLDTSWVKYDPSVTTQNSMLINTNIARVDADAADLYYTHSHTYLSNNFLLNAQYSTITGNEMLINITPLKNQLTPEGLQAENSPHSLGLQDDFCLNYLSRGNTEFRTYHKIAAGTNQIRGDDQLCLNYTAYTDKVLLKSDNVTYFHMPNTMNPYYWMNINYRRVPSYPADYKYGWQILPVAVERSQGFDYEDFVGLLRSGAIPGNDPMTSDKIFKMRADYRYFSNWGDTGRPGNRGTDWEGFNTGDNFNGTWLCAWLQAAPKDEYDQTYGPVWMDRYYDDTRFSDQNELFEKPANCMTGYLDGAQAISQFGYVDVPSELRLERGVLYAYHHIGKKDNKAIINAFRKYLVQDQLDNYTQVISGVDSVGSPGVEDGYPVYDVTGTQYGKSKAPDPPYGDFRLSFWMHSDDWTKKFGHQVMGNYVNEGFAVVNDDTITPILTFKDTDNIKMTNTDGYILTTIKADQYTDSVATSANSNIQLSRESPLGNITVVTSTPGYALVNRFNYNGALVNTLIVNDQLFSSVNSRISKVVTFKPDRTAVNPEEVMYVMFESSDQIGQIRLNTGDYRDTGSDNYFAAATLSGIEIENFSYDGLYVINSNRGSHNGAPIYTRTSSEQTVYTMFYDGAKWVVTTEPIDRIPDANNVVSDEADSLIGPSVWTNSSNGSTGKTALAYDQTLKRPIFVKVDNTPDYRDMCVSEIGDLFVIDGTNVCYTHAATEKGSNNLYFVNDNNVYKYTMSETTVYEAVANKVLDCPGHTINNIKVDHQENIWIFFDNEYVAKYDETFKQICCVKLSDHVTGDRTINGAKSFDLIHEFRENGEEYHGAIVFHKEQDQDGTDIIHIDPYGKVILDKVVTETITDETLLPENINISNWNTLNRSFHKYINTFTFKFRAKNRFNPLDYVDVNFNQRVNNLTPGWHHFCFGYDAKLKSLAYFYVDGILVGEISLTTPAELGKHGFTDVMSKLSTVGATQGYNNVLLSEYIQQPGYYFIKGGKIKSYRLYNYNLLRTYVKALAREHAKIEDIEWVIPCGRRSHVEQITKFHKHQLPGYKTGDYKINIANTNLSSDAQMILQSGLSATVYDYTPAHTQSIEYNWLEHPDYEAADSSS